jgi:hypothetical protein
MTDPSVPFAVFVGLTLRMMIPILITIIIVLGLTRLDTHWKNEAVAGKRSTARHPHARIAPATVPNCRVGRSSD